MSNVYSVRNTFVLSHSSKRDCMALQGAGANAFIDATGETVVVRDGLFIDSEKDRRLAHDIATRRGLLSRLKIAWRVVREKSDYAQENDK